MSPRLANSFSMRRRRSSREVLGSEGGLDFGTVAGFLGRRGMLVKAL